MHIHVYHGEQWVWIPAIWLQKYYNLVTHWGKYTDKTDPMQFEQSFIYMYGMSNFQNMSSRMLLHVCGNKFYNFICVKQNFVQTKMYYYVKI